MTATTKSGMIKRGDLILAEEPFVYTVSGNQVDSRCSNCLKSLQQDDNNTKSRCAACKYSRYCSSKCQKIDWKRSHKAECPGFKLLEERGFRPPDHFFLMLKILLKSEEAFEQTSICEPYHNSPRRTYEDLIFHEDEMRLSKDVMDYVPQLRLILAKYMGIDDPRDLPSEQVIFEMFGKVKCNSYGILDDDLITCGVGLYLNASVFDHSCRPNACQIFDGARIFIRATEDIADFSEVRISYIDRFAPLKQRQDHIFEGYFFTCTCSSCSNPSKDAEMFALRCANPKCDHGIPCDQRAYLPCSACQTSLAPEVADATLLTVANFSKTLDEIAKKTGDLVEMRAAAATVERSLHPMNPLLASLYSTLGRVMPPTDENAEEFFGKAADIYRHWLPSPAVDPLMGWTCLEAAYESRSGDPAPSRRYLVEAQQILHITHGPDHPLCRKLPRF
ncbi:putative Histone-lysine N-methyltransferase ASHR1 [Hypsibius exemplaris]|uniref:Histone-lysine N-methyltransferase ASHR1 n=1 Tax=Hypsibius exemplaris TaxID=2072580 RepID=A0A1W0XD25_HYPEX|nr:putative Histone-lysine N-methyltransferase ASHR1 [Hypsibius exemplaris]